MYSFPPLTCSYLALVSASMAETSSPVPDGAAPGGGAEGGAAGGVFEAVEGRSQVRFEHSNGRSGENPLDMLDWR